MSLAELQQILAGAFGGLTPLADRPELRAELERIVAEGRSMTPVEQADVYREQFWLRHQGALREDFPGLRHVVGEERFDDLVRAYLLAHPPDSWTLRDLCRKMASFCAGWGGLPAEVAPLARDMARFEVAFEDIFDGADVAPIGPDAVGAVPDDAWPAARIGFHPLLTLLVLDHPVHEIRLALRKGNEPPAVARARTHVAMWRGADLKVHYRAIAAGEHELVEALRRGTPLGRACADVAASGEPEVEARIGTWFRAWAMRGWIVAITADRA
jgi:hypothetical protein